MKNGAYSFHNIKSKKILKYIFNHLENHKKLFLVNYNKFLQDKFGFTIGDYRKNAKRIKIIGLNGYRKEYSFTTYKLVFEGKYSKWKRNGKGIEYYENGSKKFEGEYLNGEMYNGVEYDENGNEIAKINNGKVRELYDNGFIKFEGEYLNGKKWNGKGYTYYGIKLYEIKNGTGYIREYNPDGTLLFKGYYLNGEKNGRGKEYLNGYLLFEGNYLKGRRNGVGREYLNGNLLFVGNYLNGERNGGGKEYLNGNLLFEGNYLNGRRNGEGREYLNGNLLFKGNYLNGERNKEGKEYYNIFRIYFKGEYLRWNGREYDYNGNLINAIAEGKKGLYYLSCRYFLIIYKELRLLMLKDFPIYINIFGKIYFFGELIFEGQYVDGKRHGLGKQYYINGNIEFEGEYKDGKINGKGKEYDYFGRLIFEGEYVNNKRMNGIIYKYKNNNFSKYVYLMPSAYFLLYNNNVPIDIKENFFEKYNKKISAKKRLMSKWKLNDNRNERIIIDKRKNNWKKNKKCRWSINSGR